MSPSKKCMRATSIADRHVLAEPQHHVRRVLRDEVRPGPDDPALADRLLLLLQVLLPLTDDVRVDLEVDDRLAAQRLDQLDLGVDRRQFGPLGRWVEILAPNSATTVRPSYARSFGYRASASSGTSNVVPPNDTFTPPLALTSASSRFIGGVPMNPATKRFAGVS